MLFRSSTVDTSDGVGVGYAVAGTSFSKFSGYIADFRVVKGTAVYTGAFTPPTAPLTAIANTSLLCSFTNAGIYDSAMMNDLETVGNAQISTSVKKYGTGSMYFDGTGDYLTTPSSQNLSFGTGDFTIEFWMNASAAGTYTSVLGTQSIAGSTTAGMWRVSNRLNSVNGIYFNYTTGSTFTDVTFTTTNYNDNAWHHVAVTRSSNVLRAFVDGVKVGSDTSITQSLSSGQRLYVGFQAQDSVYYTGYIADLRITKGYARYTNAYFIPPASQLATTQSGGTSGTVTTNQVLATNTKFLSLPIYGLS